MTRGILASLLPRDQTQELSGQEAADMALLEIEKLDDGLVAVNQGSELYQPAEMRLLDLLERQGLIKCELVTMVGAMGKNMRATYYLTPLGRMKVNELKLTA
jgi:hypothetical protein